MTFDPFQLVPTSTEISPFNLEKPDGSFTSILPKLPPSNYENTQQGTQAKPSVSLQNLLDASAQSTIAPEYEYTFEQEKRYSNPYLQFNPKPLGGFDTEDIYGKFQGSGEQLWNSLVKTGATALSSFVSSFTSFGSSIDALRGGQPYDEDSYLGQTQSWLKNLENEYPNYYTQWERDHPFQSAITPVGMTNFWGDKVLKNVGFTVGSLASSLLVDTGIELLTGGGATPATFVLLGKQIKNAVAPLKNAFRNLAKTSTLNKVDDLAGISRVGNGINEGLKNLNSFYNFKRGVQFAGTTYFAAQGEAMIEGYQTYWDTKAKLYQQELDKGTLDINKVQEIEQISQEAANTTTALNLPIIMASNLLQFPTIFAGKSILKQFDSPFLDIVNKEGLTVVNNYSRKQAWVNTMKELTKDFVTEGGEEGYQYYVGNSIHDYYVDKFNGTATKTLSNYLKNQIPNTIKDEKFWESFVVGGLAGGLMGSYHTIKTNLIGANERAQRAADTLKPVYDRFNDTVKDYVHFAETVEHEQDNDQVNKFHTAHKALFSTVHDSLRYGIFDNLQDSIEDLRNLPVEEYNKLFQTEFNEQEKLNHLNKIQGESLRIKDELTQVNKFFQKNPFDSPYVNQRLKDIYKIDQTQLEGVKAKLFQDYKELTAYNISRLRNTRGRISDIEQELTTMGLDDSVIPVIFNLDSKEGVREYKRIKAVQLNAVQDELEYYNQLGKSTPELKQKINSLKKLQTQLDSFDKDMTDSEKEKLRTILFKEELGNKQLMAEEEFRKKQEELKRQQEIAVKTAEDLEKQTTTSEQKVKEQVETISKIVPKEEKKVAPPTSPDQQVVFNKNFGSLNEGDQFRIDLSTESGTFTLLTKSPFVAEKDGIKYQFTPQGVIKFDNGEQRLRYALNNIGLEVVQSVPKQLKPEVKTQPEALPQGTDITQIRKQVAEIIDPGSWDYADTPSVKITSIMTGFKHEKASQAANARVIKSKPEVKLDTLESLLENQVITKGEYELVKQKISIQPEEKVKDKPTLKKKIIQDLLDTDGNIRETFTRNGYVEIDGIFVHPNVIETFNKLTPETKQLLKQNGIIYVDDFSREGAAGVSLGYSYNNRNIMGIGLADVGIYNNPNKIALHELGHVVWEKLSKEEQDLFYDGNPVTGHGKKVLNPTGKFKDLYGEGSLYGEEDFAELFAENNGDLVQTLKKKKESLIKPQKQTITKQVQIKQAADQLRTEPTSPVKDGIYLLKGDNKFAWRYVDQNTAVPLILKIQKGKLIYQGDMSKGIEKRITQGYLLDDQYIQDTQDINDKGVDVTSLLEDDYYSQTELGVDVTSLLDTELTKEPLSLSSLSEQLKSKENQKESIDKFIKEPISDQLRQVLEWRLGKGITIDC